MDEYALIYIDKAYKKELKKTNSNLISIYILNNNKFF